MKRVTPIILAAAALLVTLDVVGELAGKPLGFPYASLGVVSLVVYVAVGAICAWRARFETGLLAAALVGFLDGTLGPLAAWLVGQGPVAQEVTEPRVFAYSIAVVTAIAAAAGLLGAAAGSWLERRRGVRGVVPR
jgi:fucose 4-O-acetylase-like acetyltransferase